MKKWFILPMFLLLGGCLTRVTSRVDTISMQLEKLGKDLEVINGRLEKIDKSTTKLAKVVP